MKIAKVLYISYDSALEPIPQSQVIPYLRELSKYGYIFHWLSFDKTSTLGFKKKIKKMKEHLIKNDIFLHSLAYYRRPYLISKLFNILTGVFVSFFYVLKYDISFIHCRSEVASLIGIIIKTIFRKKILYDRRGFMAEDYVEGGMWKSRVSFLYKLLIFIDNRLLLYSDEVIVLTHKMKDWLISNRPWTINKIKVIPCCVDFSRFIYNNGSIKNELGLKGKFLFVYSGSLGTWYLLNEMIDFFITAKKIIPNAHFLILTISDQGIAKNAIERKKAKIEDFTIKCAPFEEVHRFLQDVDASICFIKPVISKIASSPTKLAEFLASGIPVVINSGIGDCDEIIKKENIGVIVKDFTNDDYEVSVHNLLLLMRENSVLKNKCIESARKYFSLGNGVAKYNEIYKTLS